MSRVLPSSLALCLVALAATRVMADPAGEQLFQDGKQLLKDGNVDAACTKFQQSREVEAKVGTLLNLADCRERQGKLATAWAVFLEAKALAALQKDPRGAFAAQRAAAIEGKRAFLVITVPADHRVPGLVVTRNGTAVAAATWDQELPIDPGSYVIEVKASGYRGAVVNVEIAPQAHGTATVPALIRIATAEPVERPVEPRHPPDVGTTAPPPIQIEPPIRNLAVGLAIGATTDGDLTPGARAIAQARVGPGAARAVFTFLYARLANNRGDSADDSDLYAFGLGFDYLFAWKSGFASAAGLGFGIDLNEGGYNPTSTHQWLALRASPIIARIGGPHLEIGLHAVMIVQTTPILIGTIAVDWFYR